jgi:hypothetical protein
MIMGSENRLLQISDGGGGLSRVVRKRKKYSLRLRDLFNSPERRASSFLLRLGLTNFAHVIFFSSKIS